MKTIKKPYQTVELGHGALAAWLADVPDLDTALAAGVDVACGVADGDRAHHLPVAKRVDLASVAWDARAYQCIWRKGHGLHLTVRAHVKRISSAETRGTERRPVGTKKHSLSLDGKQVNPQLTVSLQKWT